MQVLNVYITNSMGSGMPRFFHSHPDHMEVTYVFEGKGIYYLDHKSYEVKKGDLILFNAGGIHGEDPSTGNDICTYSLALKDISEPTLLPNHLVPQGAYPIIHCNEDTAYIDAIMKMACSLPTSPHHKEIRRHLAEAIYYYCLDHLPQNRLNRSEKSLDLVKKAKEYIDENFNQEISCAAIAAKLHVNASYLSRIFKQIMHFSMKEYQKQLRLGAIQTLLIDTPLELQEIALRCGYLDMSHFHSVFKKNTGMTPSKYRETFHIMSETTQQDLPAEISQEFES